MDVFNGFRALIVDDCSNLRQILSAILYRFGFQHVRDVDNTEDAFQCLEVEHFDVIITDFLMSGEDGLGLARRIRSEGSSDFNKIPIILLSGFDDHKLVQNAQCTGVDAVVLKPLDSQDLYSQLSSLLVPHHARNTTTEMDQASEHTGLVR